MVVEAIRIISFNCLGLKWISKYRRERLHEIGHRLAASDPAPEIVGLQECWCQEDYRTIRDCVKEILPYSKFYYSGIFGGGLVILSKWPIEESSMVRYSLNGRPTAFFRGDWYVGKGVACAKIRFGASSTDIVEVFCTHLHAPYEAEPNDSYLCHRTAQAWQIAKLMHDAVARGHLVIGLGDFNMLPCSFAHRLIESRSLCHDVWRLVHPDSSLGPADHPDEQARGRNVPTAEYNITKNGAASDGVLNTWRWSKHQQARLRKGEDISIDMKTPDPHAKRLDYIFLGGDVAPNIRWAVKNVNLGMLERHPVLKCSLSDHFSVEATIERRCVSQSKEQSPPRNDEIDRSVAMYEDILGMIATYRAREVRQQKLRLWHFGGSIVVFLLCLLASWFVFEPYATFLLVLFSNLFLISGILDGIIGGLFVNAELRDLKEFEWEIRNAKNLSSSSGSI